MVEKRLDWETRMETWRLVRKLQKSTSPTGGLVVAAEVMRNGQILGIFQRLTQ